ncbi:MAG TPA: primosomal protein N' [Alphaproteobacteria bacterium]|nr:primosomal protein N' [Alphaproteobacteria bacterium]
MAGSVSRTDTSGGPTRRAVSVLLPYPLGPYDYIAPPEMALVSGDYVQVPLGPREILGVVWGEGLGDVAAAKMRPVAGRFDAPPMPEDHRRFIEWVAAYTLSAPGSVLRMSLTAPKALEPPRAAVAYRRADSTGEMTMTAARKRVLAVLEERGTATAAELAEAAGCGVAVVRGMADTGALETVMLPFRYPASQFHSAEDRPVLSHDQSLAAKSLKAKLGAGYSATLLDGVTGAGKTEVYFEAIAANIEAGRQSLILLPEIALSGQFIDRFAKRFGIAPALWHSDVGPTGRRAVWRGVAEGKTKVVVGARSALFLPYPDLGLIVVDEEHEAAFKQEDGVIYHARDMAVARAHQGGFPIVLVSATPSLETVVNTEVGRYDRLFLPARHGGASLPKISLIDMRHDPPPPRRFLSPILVQAIADALAAGEQAMLFLNRRGYAPLTLCRTCGHRMQCPNCTAWLVEHRFQGLLRCHHCDHAEPIPSNCPQCDNSGTFAACGPGVERISDEVTGLFPEARISILASDMFQRGSGYGAMALQEAIRQVRDHEIDIVVGTQIIAKGHHFPMLTLVGVVDADLGLNGGDLRASERTYQLLHQVAGRAGRAERPGQVLLQTYMPEHRVMQALADDQRDSFLAVEAEERRDAAMPPYARLAALIVSGEDGVEVGRTARMLAGLAPRGDGIVVLGPAPAPLAILRGMHRERLLLKARRDVPVQPLVADWMTRATIPNSVRVQVDIDPYSFL